MQNVSEQRRWEQGAFGHAMRVLPRYEKFFAMSGGVSIQGTSKRSFQNMGAPNRPR